MVLVVVLVVRVDQVVVHHIITLLEEDQHLPHLKEILEVLEHLLHLHQHMEQVAVVVLVVLVVLVLVPVLEMVELVFNSHQHSEIQNQQLDFLDPVELTGLLVVVVERPMVPHQLLVVVEVLHPQLFLHMLVLDMVHIIQIQGLVEKVQKKIADPVAVVVDQAPHLVMVGLVVLASFSSHILPN